LDICAHRVYDSTSISIIVRAPLGGDPVNIDMDPEDALRVLIDVDVEDALRLLLDLDVKNDDEADDD
jgi:hypothetical protein